MITTGGKLWLAIGAFAVVAAEIYFLCTGGEDGGAVTLLFLGVAALVIGGAAIAVRDGDAAVAGSAEGTKEPVVVRSALPAPWPVVAAIGAGLAVVGYAVGGVLLYGGFGVMGVALLEWMVQGWAERSTGDRVYNQALRNRIMYPIEVPALGLLGVGFVILTFSRILLAAPDKNVSTIIAIAAGVVITAGAFLVASRPKISSNALAWVLAVGAVALLGAGIVTGVAGERGVEHHEQAEHQDGELPGDIDDGLGGGNETETGPSANENTPEEQETTTTVGTNP